VTKEQVSFDDSKHFSAVPRALFEDRRMGGDEFAVYAVMKSFGPRAEAKVETLAARLRWPAARVRSAQRSLEKAGWLVLVREGKRLKKDIYLPRLWWVRWSKDEVAPQPEEVGVTNLGPPTSVTHEKGLRKKAPLKVGSPKNGGAETDKALKTDKANKTERDKEKGNSGKKNPLSAATPTPTGHEALALMNPAYRAKHGVDLHPSSAADCLAAWRVYGDDLVPAWTRFVADPGTRGRMDLTRHPIPIFTSQPNLWATPPAVVGTDPVKAAEAQAAQARARAEKEARVQADHAAAEKVAAAWPRLSAQLREQILDQVAALNGFMADIVTACRQRRGGNFEPHSALCAAVMELRPDLAGGQHG
jgi:hypothetical protein